MLCKTFTTHTLSLIKNIEAIELALNVWLSNNKNIKIIKTDYFINQRTNSHNTTYEELTLFIYYTNQ